MAVMQRVDPFIPVKNQRPTPQGQYGAQWLRKSNTATSRTSPTIPPPSPAKIPSLPVTPKRPALPAPSRPRSVDGVMPWRLKSPPQQPTPSRPKLRGIHLDILPAAPKHHQQHRPTESTEPTTYSSKTQPVAPRIEETLRTKNHKLLPKAQIGALVFGAIGAGLSIQFLPLGELAIGIYAVYAIARRLPSRTSFLLALIALIGIIVLLAVRGVDSMSQNFAV